MVGEPVLFNYEVKNTGNEVVYVNAKSAGKCLDTYEFLVSAPGTSCGAKWDAQCRDELAALPPGESYSAKWTLNTWFDFEHPGNYEVTAKRHIPIRSARGQFQEFSFSSKFTVTLEPVDSARVQGILERFEQDLQSSDPEVRHEALDVLATTAPDYFQGIALRLARGKDAFAAYHAIAALERMNTPEARAAMADVLTTAQPANNDEVAMRGHALQGLGLSGDASYLTLVARFTEDKNRDLQLAAMVAVAQLGKEAAVPQLQRFFFSDDAVVRKNAAQALRYSPAPEAVDALIGAIPDKDSNVREQALASLVALTGHSLETEGAASPQTLQDSWRNWWQANKARVKLTPTPEFICHM